MRIMKKEEIAHLASLSRIRLSDEELMALEGELSTIVEYVGAVSDIAADDGDSEPTLSARYNVFRKDETTNQPDEYTEDLLAEMPETDGRYMVVKKILNTEE